MPEENVFDAREWFLRPFINETDAQRIARRLGEAGFADVQVNPALEEGWQEFRFRFDGEPLDYAPEVVYVRLADVLRRAGFSLRFARLANDLVNGMVTGEFYYRQE